MKFDKFAEEFAQRVKAHVDARLLALGTAVDELRAKFAALPAPIPGPRGEKGDKGDSVKGDKGDKGDPGVDGLSVKGDKGDKGDRGDDGVGIPGKDGAPGASAYEVAKQAGFAGSLSEWLLSLKGADAVSVPGRDGADGKSVTLEEVQPLIASCVKTAVAEVELPAPDPAALAGEIELAEGTFLAEMSEAFVGALRDEREVAPLTTHSALEELRKSLLHITDVIQMPVKPVRDAKGRVIGAQRVNTLETTS